MRVKMLTFRYSATLGGFDDTPLVELARDKELIAVRDHFFLVNEIPHLACLVTYQDAVVPRATLDAARALARDAAEPAAPFSGPPRWANDGRRRRSGDRPDPTAGLCEQDRVLFNTLRDWRTEQSQKEGVPVYVLFNNRQFLELLAKRPDSLTAIANLDGFGASKVEKYGQALLAILHGAPRAEVAPPLPSAGCTAAPIAGSVPAVEVVSAIATTGAPAPPGSAPMRGPARPTDCADAGPRDGPLDSTGSRRPDGVASVWSGACLDEDAPSATTAPSRAGPNQVEGRAPEALPEAAP